LRQLGSTGIASEKNSLAAMDDTCLSTLQVGVQFHLIQVTIWGFPKIMVITPKWIKMDGFKHVYFMENPNLKWMITRGTTMNWKPRKMGIVA